ncbi:MAG: nitrilase-related carbon-nitrogen hydrolase [Candidatus Ranarchaeia archaeon]
MLVSAVQFQPKLGDTEYNREKAATLIENAVKKGVKLIVLPELANSGYNFKTKKEAEACSEQLPDSLTVKTWANTLNCSNSFVIAGYNEKDNNRLYNSAVLIGPEGFIGKYRKIHLFAREKTFFSPGDLYPQIFRVDDIRLGIIICFDWIFPELTRSLALMGADIICHSANLVLPYCQHVMVARSIENHLFTITANRVGVEGELTFTGLSQITDPYGHVLTKGSKDHEEIITATIDHKIARNKQLNPYNDLFRDRRPEFYKAIFEKDEKVER